MRIANFTAHHRPGCNPFPISFADLKVGGGGGLLSALLLAVMIGAPFLFSAAPGPAAAQDRWLDLPAPTGVAAVNGANPGEVIISWDPVAGAAFYRIAWIAAADAAAITENGGDWLSAITYANITAAVAATGTGMQHTLTRLNPGVRYTFLVGSMRVTGGTPSWSAPAELNLALGALRPDATREITVPLGLTANEPGAFGGYTLFAKQGDSAYLIDPAGNIVRRWDIPRLRHIRLFENGNVLGQTYGGDRTLYEIDPAGNIIWNYRHPKRMHHDFLKLPNGNVVFLVRDRKTAEEAVAAGANPAFVPPDGVQIDVIVEVRPIYPDRAAIVWEWSVWDHLVQDYDPAKANYGKVSEHPELVDINYNLRQASRTTRNRVGRMLHANGLDYNPELDQILISARNVSEIWIIDHSTTTEEAAGPTGGNSGKGGDLLYRWGNPQVYRAGTFADQQLFWQHNPYWIPEGRPGAGNILIFNNGDGYEGRYVYHSSVVEITPPASGYGYAMAEGGGIRYGPAQPTWTYVAENPTDFLSRRFSNAQRLPNGNTMILSGQDGVIFEVTPGGKTVWRYVIPVVNGGRLYQGDPILVWFDLRTGAGQYWSNSIYRAYRFAPDYPGLQHYDLTPQGTVERYRNGAD